MKHMFLSIIFTILLSGSAFSQTNDKKTDLFNDLKSLRLQYRLDKYYLTSIEKFGEGSRYQDEKVRLSETKVKIDSLDKEYAKLLNGSELNAYLQWKKNEDMKDRMQYMGWWYQAYQRKGC